MKKAVMSEFQTLARLMSPEIDPERRAALLKGMSKYQDNSAFGPSAVTGV